MLTQYGVSVIKLSDMVDRFCLKQGNMRESYYPKFLVYAEWAWKELFRNSIWEVKQIAVDVDCRSHTFRLPDDCERIVNISVMDKFRKLQPLTCNPDYNTVEMRCQKNKCSCERCHGENTLCSILDNITVTYETVSIQGADYTMTTWVRYNGNGSLQTEQLVPTYDQATDEVIFQTIFTTLCNIEVDDKGCIKPTAPNINAFVTYCGWDSNSIAWNGWGVTNKAYQRLIPSGYNYYGEWKPNATDPSIIHIFRHDLRAHTENDELGLRGEENDIHRVILAYQTNGTVPCQEILIPEYAEMAVNAGMIYQQRFFNPRDGDKDESGLRAFRRAKKSMEMYLNPIRMTDIAEIQTALRRW